MIEKINDSTLKMAATQIPDDECTLNRKTKQVPTACLVTWIKNFTLNKNRKQDQSTNLVFSDSNSELGTSSELGFRFTLNRG
jgi:hypothetical protein